MRGGLEDRKWALTSLPGPGGRGPDPEALEGAQGQCPEVRDRGLRQVTKQNEMWGSEDGHSKVL